MSNLATIQAAIARASYADIREMGLQLRDALSDHIKDDMTAGDIADIIWRWAQAGEDDRAEGGEDECEVVSPSAAQAYLNRERSARLEALLARTKRADTGEDDHAKGGE